MPVFKRQLVRGSIMDGDQNGTIRHLEDSGQLLSQREEALPAHLKVDLHVLLLRVAIVDRQKDSALHPASTHPRQCSNKHNLEPEIGSHSSMKPGIAQDFKEIRVSPLSLAQLRLEGHTSSACSLPSLFSMLRTPFLPATITLKSSEPKSIDGKIPVVELRVLHQQPHLRFFVSALAFNQTARKIRLWDEWGAPSELRYDVNGRGDVSTSRGADRTPSCRTAPRSTRA